MGYMNARDMAEHLGLTDDALRWHLQYNHYPPVPALMLQPCKDAIQACIAEDYELGVKMPDGVSYRGKTVVPAREVVEALHLQAFIDVEAEREP